MLVDFLNSKLPPQLLVNLGNKFFSWRTHLLEELIRGEADDVVFSLNHLFFGYFELEVLYLLTVVFLSNVQASVLSELELVVGVQRIYASVLSDGLHGTRLRSFNVLRVEDVLLLFVLFVVEIN